MFTVFDTDRVRGGGEEGVSHRLNAVTETVLLVFIISSSSSISDEYPIVLGSWRLETRSSISNGGSRENPASDFGAKQGS